jgi:hypothetical protein
VQFSLSDLPILPDDQIVIPEVWFTLEGYGPVTVMAIWEKATENLRTWSPISNFQMKPGIGIKTLSDRNFFR